MHPLYGSNLRTLHAVIRQSGGLGPAQWAQMALFAAAAIGRSPFSAYERRQVARKLAAAPPMPPPIFILGHWRSGTTHLYNILSRADFGYVPPLATGLPWDFMELGALLRPLLERALPEHRYIDNVPVRPDSPQEDEIALANMTPLSFYHGLYFPGNFQHFFQRGVFFEGCSKDEIEEWKQTFLYFMNKLHLTFGKRLLIKNPVYTARVSLLRELYPQAKFIHITRNPYEVFVSMRNFYNKLFKQFALQSYDHVDIDDVIFSTYTRMMNTLHADIAALPASQYIDLRYENLDADPIGQIRLIYDQLELEGFVSAKPHFEAYLASITSYKKNRFTLTPEIADTIERHWAPFLKRFGYQRPQVAPPSPAAREAS